jgi:hypothetical protein
VNVLVEPVILIVPSPDEVPAIAGVINALLDSAKTIVAVPPDVVSSKVTGPLPLKA